MTGTLLERARQALEHSLNWLDHDSAAGVEAQGVIAAIVDERAHQPPKLTKADTVALWHAVVGMRWQIVGMREVNKEEPGKFTPEQFAVEQQRLLAARRALRKVNAIRKAQP